MTTKLMTMAEERDSRRKADRKKMFDAIAELRAGGFKNHKTLSVISRAVGRGGLTARQLTIINNARESMGFERVSVEVHDRERDKKRWTEKKEKHEVDFAALTAPAPPGHFGVMGRPLKPPGRK